MCVDIDALQRRREVLVPALVEQGYAPTNPELRIGDYRVMCDVIHADHVSSCSASSIEPIWNAGSVAGSSRNGSQLGNVPSVRRNAGTAQIVRSSRWACAEAATILWFERCRPSGYRLRAALCTLSTHDSVGV